MQDNNNSSLTNGDTRSPDRFANIRAAEERKLLARNNGHKSKKIIMDQVTNIPIPEDDNEDADKNSGHESGGTASTPVDADNTDSVLLKNNNQKNLNHPRRALEAVYTHYEISKKSRIPFLVLSAACLILLLVVIILAIVWPYIPSYMRADVCIEPECFDASKQVSFLVWVPYGISSGGGRWNLKLAIAFLLYWTAIYFMACVSKLKKK